MHSTAYAPSSFHAAPRSRLPRRNSGTSAGRNPMGKIFALVGIAIIVFMVFTAFSVQTAVKGREKLSAIKDLYFPVLERVDADIVRIDKMEELYIQVVVLGDRDALDTANEQATKADGAFKEIAGCIPSVGRKSQNFGAPESYRISLRRSPSVTSSSRPVSRVRPRR